MRARHHVLMASFASLASLVVFGVTEGCGGSSESGPAAAVDSGLDATKDGTSDAVSDAPALECIDADITKIEIPDGSLGDGGANTAECAGCLKTNCSGELQLCQDDCDCREGVVSFFTCVGKGKSLQACAGSLVSVGSVAQSLGLCAINAGCADKCGAPIDAGPKTDASTDAATDGG